MTNYIFSFKNVFLVSLLCIPCDAAVSDTTCTSNTHCTVINSECDTDGRCRCLIGHYDEGNNCPPKQEPDETCILANQPTECVSNAVCTDTGSGLKCYCNNGFFDNNFAATGGQCVAELQPGATCTQNNQSTECVTNAICKDEGLGLKCNCNTGFFFDIYNAFGEHCVAVRQVGEICLQVNQPTECVFNSICKYIDGVPMCHCKTGYYNNFASSGGQCVPELQLGETCKYVYQPEECVPNALCKYEGSGPKCSCYIGYYDNNFAASGGQCVAEIALGGICTVSGSADECILYSTCTSVGSDLRCQCSTGYYIENSNTAFEFCVPEKALGAICTMSGSANECVPYSICTSVGSDLRCQCSIGYYDNDTDTNAGMCVPELQSGVTCTRENDATECVPNSICENEGSGLKCYCNTGFYDNNFAVKGGQCVAEIALSVTCTQENVHAECVPNAVCQRDELELKCICSNGFYDSNFADSGGTCTIELELEATCTRDNDATECLPNSICKDTGSGLKCYCNTGFYDNNFAASGGKCVAEHEPDETCTQANQPTECVSNAVCTDTGSGLKCYCNTRFYDNNVDASGGQCVAEKESGVMCTRENDATECVPNSICKSGVCTCNTGFYDDNFSNTEGQCVSELESGETCTLSNLPTECIKNAVCKSDGDTGLTCTCNSGYYDSNFANTGGSCILELQAGVTCTHNNQPTECVPNAVCRNKGSGIKCYCTSDYYDSNGSNSGGTCNAKILVDQGCTNYGPSDQCKDLKSQCTQKSGSFKCACITNYYNYVGTCTPQTALGVNCDSSQTGECKDPLSSCVPADSGHKCLCNVRYYDYSGTCTTQVELENLCTANRPDNQCIDQNAECKDSNGLKCLCTDTFYKDSNGECHKKVDLNATCITGQPADQCSDPLAECTSSKLCYCKNEYFENSGNVCTKKVLLNDVCSSGQSNYQCADVNSECKIETETSDTKCQCNKDFYANTSHVCVPKSELGSVCSNGQPDNQCSVTNSECIAEAANSLMYRCFCKATFYRDVQTCKYLIGLQVQNLEVPRYTTGEVYFKITWIIPNTVGFINKYQLRITVNGGTSENLIDIVKTENQYNMTNRQPGHTYIVEVISVETASRPETQTTSVVLQAGTRPAVPSAIITNDILGSSITVSWTVVGIIQHLSGTINGTAVTPKAFNITYIPPSQTPKQQFDTVHNGERYVITVKAYSYGFTSAEFSATIRTISTQPNPPVIETCDSQDLYENHMDLRWKEPQTPNGDISHYIIYMSSTEVRTINTDSSSEVQRIENLLPQRQYCFQMETLNDAVSPQSNKSPRSSQVCCFTRVGVARLPQNVTLVEVKSRSINLSWMTPTDVKGVLYGYRVSLIVDGVCIIEVIYQCIDCYGTQIILPKTCDVQKKVTINSVDANSKVVTTIDGLFPYISYHVWIAAVNGQGDGEKNETLFMTDSEVPEIPRSVVTTVQSATVIQVRWTKPIVKPGNTTYRVKAYEVLGGTYTYVKDITVNGYDIETVDFTGLEEYWDYTFTVTTSTIKGPATSPMTTVVKTNQAPPGKVTKFEIMTPANVFTTMQVAWAIPLLRERNSIIKEYIIKHNISGVTIVETIPAESEVLQKFYYITPDRYYKVELSAANILNQHGEKVQKIYFASSKSKAQLSDTGYSIETVVGAAVGGILCSVIVLVLIFWLFWRHRNNKTSKPSRTKHAREESKIGDQYEDIGMDNASFYQDFEEKDNPNVYDQIGRVHTVDKHYENMLP
ncbi:protein eyes shut homolog [Mytilus edulis]|uniref:protein eyes shut homolog n=1 Tax=Mytilus edulis TaxID=6550 RepID=UPI0039EF146B